MIWTRRQLLGLGGAMAGMAALGALAKPSGAHEPLRTGTGVAGKRIVLKNLHTGEELETEFFRGGEYVADAFAAIQVLLRDFRNDAQHAIDPKLMDYLCDVAQHLGGRPGIQCDFRLPVAADQCIVARAQQRRRAA
jgi:uncharacterized protein YcbK (DUF882 family)